MGSSSGHGSNTSNYDLSFKILLIGDSAVGKSSLLVSFISNSVDDLSPTIGIILYYYISNLLCIIFINMYVLIDVLYVQFFLSFFLPLNDLWIVISGEVKYVSKVVHFLNIFLYKCVYYNYIFRIYYTCVNH